MAPPVESRSRRQHSVFAVFITASTSCPLGVIRRWQKNASVGRKSLASVLNSFGASDAYVNYLGDEGPSAVKASYGANYAQLARLKKKYDPDNFFRFFNQNILPAGYCTPAAASRSRPGT